MGDNLESYLQESDQLSLNEEYCPEPEKIYIYNGLEYLNCNEDLMQSVTTTKFVNIVPYHVNMHCAEPFLEFALIKTFEENNKDEFTFITLPRVTIKDMKDDCKSIATSFVSGYCDADKVKFAGFLNDNENMYVFYELNIHNNFSSGLFRITPLWFVTVDEILNKRSVCNITVNETVSEFFTDFIDLIILKNENDCVIEVPSVFYTGTHHKKLKFDSIFSRGAIESGIFGKSCYFTDYKNAVKEGGWSHNNEPMIVHGKKITEDKSDNGRFIRGGIIRYVVFLKRNKVLFNCVNDDIDSLNNDDLTKRITDRNGLWMEEYDSISVGRPTLDNGNPFSDGPIVAVKEYNHFMPLSYHYINKATLGEVWDRHNNEYFIE